MRMVPSITRTIFVLFQIFYNLATGKTDSLHLADEAADAMKLKQQELES